MLASDIPRGTSNINLTCTMTAPKHWPRRIIDHIITPTMLARRARWLGYFMDYYLRSPYPSSYIYTSWPFGPALSVLRCGQCFGAVSVLVQSVYRWGWYLRSLRDCRSPAFVRLRQNIRGSMISNVPKQQLCQVNNSVKPLTAIKYWPCQNIAHAILCSSLFYLLEPSLLSY